MQILGSCTLVLQPCCGVVATTPTTPAHHAPAIDPRCCSLTHWQCPSTDDRFALRADAITAKWPRSALFSSCLTLSAWPRTCWQRSSRPEACFARRPGRKRRLKPRGAQNCGCSFALPSQPWPTRLVGRGVLQSYAQCCCPVQVCIPYVCTHTQGTFLYIQTLMSLAEHPHAPTPSHSPQQA